MESHPLIMTLRTKSHSKYLLIGIRSGMTDKELVGAHWFGIDWSHKPIQFTAKELAEFCAAQNSPIQCRTEARPSRIFERHTRSENEQSGVRRHLRREELDNSKLCNREQTPADTAGNLLFANSRESRRTT